MAPPLSAGLIMMCGSNLRELRDQSLRGVQFGPVYATCCRSSISSVIVLMYFSNVGEDDVSCGGDVEGVEVFLFPSVKFIFKSESVDESVDKTIQVLRYVLGLGRNVFGTKDRPWIRTSVSGPVRVLTNRLAIILWDSSRDLKPSVCRRNCQTKTPRPVHTVLALRCMGFP